MLQFQSPPPLPGLLQGALSEDKIKSQNLAITYSTGVSFTFAQLMIHATPSTNLSSGSLLFKPIRNLRQ